VTVEPPGVYLASPLGFSAPGRHWYEQVLVPLVRARDLAVLDPWSAGPQLDAALAEPAGPQRERAVRAASREIATRNFAMIRAADAVLAVLDGTDVDSGTAAEMGYALAMGVPVFGLRTDTRMSGDHELSHVNLQVEECIHASGGVIATDLAPLLDALVARVRGTAPHDTADDAADDTADDTADTGDRPVFEPPAWVTPDVAHPAERPSVRARHGRFTRVAERA
jgi:nucleoside 2-deoxyribosyltransferase